MLNQNQLIGDLKVIVFRLQNEEYGVEVGQVKSIERLEHITRVPKTPPFVKGVINLRGVVIPIIDLRGRFGLKETEYTESTRVIIVSLGNVEAGLIVDAANDVIDLSINAVEPPPTTIGGIDAAYLKGIAKLDKRLLILLDLKRILNSPEQTELERLVVN